MWWTSAKRSGSNPGPPSVDVARAKVFQKRGNFENAAADFGKAIELGDRDAALFSARGDAYLARDHFDQALADYDEVLRLEPQNAQAYRRRGDALQKKGDRLRAQADYAQASRLQGSGGEQWVEATDEGASSRNRRRLSPIAMRGCERSPIEPTSIFCGRNCGSAREHGTRPWQTTSG